MDNVDILIQSLEPEIEKKCKEIKERKREQSLTHLFIFISSIFLIVPTFMIFCGMSLFTIFIPILFVAIVFLITSPILFNKGVEEYE